MDTHADDLLELNETLDVKQAIHVGHSTGGGEVARHVIRRLTGSRTMSHAGNTVSSTSE